MTLPDQEPQDPTGNLTIVDVRLQILVFLMGEPYLHLVKDETMNPDLAAREMVKAANVLEDYVLGIEPTP